MILLKLDLYYIHIRRNNGGFFFQRGINKHNLAFITGQSHRTYTLKDVM